MNSGTRLHLAVFPYDIPAVQAWLEDQAAKGEFLSEYTILPVFVRGEPKAVRYWLEPIIQKEKAPDQHRRSCMRNWAGSTSAQSGRVSTSGAATIRRPRSCSRRRRQRGGPITSCCGWSAGDFASGPSCWHIFWRFWRGRSVPGPLCSVRWTTGRPGGLPSLAGRPWQPLCLRRFIRSGACGGIFGLCGSAYPNPTADRTGGQGTFYFGPGSMGGVLPVPGDTVVPAIVSSL